MADKLDLVFKKVVNRQYTTTQKQWYEENPGVPFKLKGSDVWIDNIPPIPPTVDTAVIKGYRETNKLLLTKDITVNDSKSWYAADGVDRLDGFISPRYGQKYTAKLFIAGGAEIPTLHACGWFFDYESGNLTFDGTAPGTGFEVVVYKYIGATADDLASALEGSAWQDPVSMIINEPTGSETGLVRYLVSNTPAGIFTDHANEIAEYDGVNWAFTPASAGKITYVISLDRLYVYDNNLGWAWSGIDSADLDYDNADSDLNALSVKDALDELDRLSKTATKLFWVDVNRVDDYVATGTTNKPFKTLAAVASIVGAGDVIQLNPGTYDGASLIIPDQVSVMGSNNTIIENSITFGSDSTSTVVLEKIKFGNAGDVVINNISTMKSLKFDGSLFINNDSVGYDIDINTNVSKSALKVNGNVTLELATVNHNSDQLSLEHIGGKLAFATSKVTGNRAGYIAESSAGNVETDFTSFINAGSGKALNLNNGATALSPNRLYDTWHRGDIDCNETITIVEGVGGGNPTSSVVDNINLIYRGGTQLKNESTIIKDVAGGTLIAKTINDSIDRVAQSMKYDATHKFLLLEPCIDDIN